MEVYTTATLEAWLLPAPPPRPEWRARSWIACAMTARDAYRGMVYDEPRFLDYFAEATPEAELSAMNIGSRPARRSPEAGVTSLRAIPWQFAWTQTRLLLGAWLGIEAALEGAIGRGDGSRLREMYRDWRSSGR
jgi:phosphoenolpyruvate carboxylase